MARVAFKQCDVERLLRAAKRVGYEHAVVDKLPNGTLRLLTDAPSPPAPSESGAEPLDAELAAWAQAHGYG